MKTRTLNMTLIAALLATSGAAQAGPGRYDADGFVTRARVISSTPIYDTAGRKVPSVSMTQTRPPRPPSSVGRCANTLRV
jgi:hypothetical protein